MHRPPPRLRAAHLASTLAAISCVAVLAAAVAGPAGAQDTTIPPTTTTAVEPPAPQTLPLSGPDLAKGSSGAEVWLLQARLVERGFWLSDAPAVFGENTRHAVVAYQKFHDIPRTGRVDALTRFHLAGTADRALPLRNNGGHTIEVDLRRQVLIVATAGRTDWVFDISSGKSSTRTPKGSFRIQRQINGLRRSALGTLWRPKYFTGGYALHGSPSVPAYAASHGCVRMTNAEIDYLWASGLASVGTPVTVY